MLPVRSIHVPRFGSLLGPSQRDEPQPGQNTGQTTQTERPSSRDKRGNKRANVTGEKARVFLKVKLPKPNKSSLTNKVTKEDRTKRRTKELAANKTKAAVSRGGAGSDSDTVVRDVFFFSERPTSEKGKAKLAVLTTISKMLEENQLTRQRLAADNQSN